MTDTADPVRPTQERLRHGGIQRADDERGADPKPWHSAEALHDVYLQTGIISKRQWAAADHFARLYFRAFSSPWRTQSWVGPINGSNDDATDDRIAAQGSLTVLASKLTPELYSVLRAVCGLHTPMSTWARDRGRSPSPWQARAITHA